MKFVRTNEFNSKNEYILPRILEKVCISMVILFHVDVRF